MSDNFFRPLLAELRREENADPEPEPRRSAEWWSWYERGRSRVARRVELEEAAALTTVWYDPAPISSEGLRLFLGWVARQDSRRAVRRSGTAA